MKRDRRRDPVQQLEQIYHDHADAVFSLAYRITRSREDAEDVLQDLFVGLPRALERYHEQGRLESWLKRIAARLALIRLRTRRRRAEVELTPADEPSLVGPHPLDAIELERAIGSLREQYRVVFVLREIEGFTHQEIGELLGISAANSAQRLARAWTQLRKKAER